MGRKTQPRRSVVVTNLAIGDIIKANPSPTFEHQQRAVFGSDKTQQPIKRGFLAQNLLRAVIPQS
jgi:hypothetical protein